MTRSQTWRWILPPILLARRRRNGLVSARWAILTLTGLSAIWQPGLAADGVIEALPQASAHSASSLAGKGPARVAEDATPDATPETQTSRSDAVEPPGHATDQPTGHLRIHAAHPIDVALDGVPMGTATPAQALSLEQLAARPYRLSVSADGYHAREVDVYINDDDWTQEAVRLWPDTARPSAPYPPSSPSLQAEPFAIVTGRCHMDYCWWWRVSPAEPVGARGDARLVRTDLAITGIGYRLTHPPHDWPDEWDPSDVYPDVPPVHAHWDSVEAAYALCSNRLPAVFFPREDGPGLVGSIPFDDDGFSYGATEGAGHLWQHLCGLAEGEPLRVKPGSERPRGAIRIDQPIDALDLLH